MNTLANSCFQYDGSDDSKNIIRIMNKNHRSDFKGNDKYFYWIANNIADTFYKMDKDLTEIPPYDYLALLTGKQLTEGEQLTDKSKHKLLYSNLTKDFTWCRVCNEHFHNSEGYHDVKLLPTQESVKDGSLGIVFTEQAENAFNHYEYPSLINTLDTSAAFWIGWRQAEIFFSTQQTAHLQQQLKQAKELLRMCAPIVSVCIEMSEDAEQIEMDKDLLNQIRKFNLTNS